jgi:hypothetical protein
MRKPPTGELCAGEPHAQFGGRGGETLSDPYQLVIIGKRKKEENETPLRPEDFSRLLRSVTAPSHGGRGSPQL